MKKSISSLLALAMLLAALSACGSKPSASSQQPGSSSAGSSTSQQQPGSSSSQDTPPAPAVDTMILKEADDNMINTYTLLAVNPDAPFSDADGNAVSGVEVNTAGAQALIQWLLSDEGMAMAADYGQADYGDSLFYLLEGAPAYTGEIAERDGVLLSSKRPGEGIGLQSVAHIAEKTGGYCKFLYGNGVFTANVMLRGG